MGAGMDSLEDAPTDDEEATRAAWHVVLEQLAARFDAKLAQVCYFDLSTAEKLLFEVTSGIDFNDELKTLYMRYGETDPRLAAARERPNEALCCRDVVDQETLHGSDIYRYVMKPLGLEYTLWIHVPEPDQKLTVWGVMRGPEGKPFNPGERQRFADLVPTFQAAVTAHRQGVLPA